MNLFDDFMNGYRRGQQSGLSRIVGFVVLFFIVIYLIQEWTGIPLKDWTFSVLGWIFNVLKSLINLLANE